jgi:hypothetical protein
VITPQAAVDAEATCNHVDCPRLLARVIPAAQHMLPDPGGIDTQVRYHLAAGIRRLTSAPTGCARVRRGGAHEPQSRSGYAPARGFVSSTVRQVSLLRVARWATHLLDLSGAGAQRETDTGVVPSDAQRIYDALGSTDKTKVSIDTDRSFTTPGARGERADTIAKWIVKRWR